MTTTEILDTLRTVERELIQLRTDETFRRLDMENGDAAKVSWEREQCLGCAAVDVGGAIRFLTKLPEPPAS